MTPFVVLLDLTVHALSLVSHIIVTVSATSSSTFRTLRSRPQRLLTSPRRPTNMAISLPLLFLPSPMAARQLLNSIPLLLAMAARFPMGQGPTLLFIPLFLINVHHLRDFILGQLLFQLWQDDLFPPRVGRRPVSIVFHFYLVPSCCTICIVIKQ